MLHVLHLVTSVANVTNRNNCCTQLHVQQCVTQLALCCVTVYPYAVVHTHYFLTAVNCFAVLMHFRTCMQALCCKRSLYACCNVLVLALAQAQLHNRGKHNYINNACVAVALALACAVHCCLALCPAEPFGRSARLAVMLARCSNLRNCCTHLLCVCSLCVLCVLHFVCFAVALRCCSTHILAHAQRSASTVTNCCVSLGVRLRFTHSW